ncbi:hypothetical protein LZQ00_01740 [Sphingobacterium sp. SRCM116780]|uniref:hypothetical protein n=1 Tax=Sphingobacterium sp. SRCM116780 TaxID=2907623 RepID=UPI001F2B518B|nr:hypothetical protein [Sphingobacterium sp. SRCM116780]UIR56556.1 hypothetical protein LZQ00_01740 [Sphingobacterium sp. SRCM116780]
MKKIFTFFSLLLIISFTASAQIGRDPNVPDHTSMMNKTWEAIDKMAYKVSYNGSKKVYTPFYPTELKSLENKIVEIPGYMVPLTSGRTHKNFMISVLPVAQCMFCGSNGIPPMVEVFIKGDAIKFTEDPVKLKGKMVFNKDPLKGNSEIMITDAVIIK